MKIGKQVFIFLIMAWPALLFAQEKRVDMKVNQDSLGIEQPLLITFSFTNMKPAEFEAPALINFSEGYVVGRSSNQSYINGVGESKYHFTVRYEPKSLGIHTIPEVAFKISNKKYNTSEITVHVVKNAVRIRKKPKSKFPFFEPKREKKKSKKKSYRI